MAALLPIGKSNIIFNLLITLNIKLANINTIIFYLNKILAKILLCKSRMVNKYK